MDLAPELIARYSRPAPRYTSYPPIPAWSRDIGPLDYREALEAVGGDPSEPVSLYLHLPFCPRRCLYCGCNVLITREREKLDRYLERLGEEFDLVCRSIGLGRRVAQLHLGGGTPNYFDGGQLRRLWRTITERFTLAPDADLSIEADPRLATAEQLGLLHDMGFDRVSFGVQDLDARVQQAIGRWQPTDQVRETVARARAAGFVGINVDLVYGLPEQTPDSFRRTVDSVIELAPDRIACFGYAHVPAMQRHQRARERYRIPGDGERLELFRVAVEGLTGAGYEWIGLDHFAGPGDALAAAWKAGRLHRNFNGYTTMPARHLIGAGMSAIGEVAGLLVQNVNDLGSWQSAVGSGDLATVRGHLLSDADRRHRAAILSLMCRLELPLGLAEGLEPSLHRLLEFTDDGLVERRGESIAVTPLGRYFLRTLCTAFDAYLPASHERRPMSRAV